MIGFGWAIAILKNLSLIALFGEDCLFGEGRSLRAPDEH
jgi:hypothetical protein